MSRRHLNPRPEGLFRSSKRSLLIGLAVKLIRKLGDTDRLVRLVTVQVPRKVFCDPGETRQTASLRKIRRVQSSCNRAIQINRLVQLPFLHVLAFGMGHMDGSWTDQQRLSPVA